MLKVKFSIPRGYRHLAKNNYPYPLIEGNRRLISLDKHADHQEEVTEVEVAILEGKEVIFRDKYLLGNRNARNLLLLVQSTMDTTFSATPSDVKTKILTKIATELTPNVAPEPLTEVEQSVKNAPPEPVTPLKKKSQKKVMSAKKWLIGCVVLIGVSFCGMIGYTAIPLIKQWAEPVKQTITFDDYFIKGDYLKALSLTHKEEEVQRVVNQLVESNAFEDLREINRIYPSKEATFELAFHDENWKAVTDTPLDELSKDRQIMMCYAYIQQNQLEEALIISRGGSKQQL